ncbi:MAG: hypothetical protein Q9218_001721 [Villophora microphyllina]
MTDPGSIFSIVGGTAGLVFQCGKVISDLHDLSDRMKYAKLTINSMSAGLETIQWTWSRIAKILEDWHDCGGEWQGGVTDVVDQINRSLAGGALVISALEEELKPYKDKSQHTNFSLRTRTKIVWNERTLKDHQDRIRDQVSSMNLLLSVLRMPEAAIRQELFDHGREVFRKSDESAYTIVGSLSSRSIRDRKSLLSFASEKPLVYHKLSIDDDLFTAGVYKRNYRNGIFAKLSLGSRELPCRARGMADRETINFGKSPTQVNVSSEQRHVSVIEGRVSAQPSANLTEPQRTDVEMANKTMKPTKRVVPPLHRRVPTRWMVGLNAKRMIEGPALNHDTVVANSVETVAKGPYLLDLTGAVQNQDIAFFEDLRIEWDHVPRTWSYHFLMTACAKGRADLMDLLLKGQKTTKEILKVQMDIAAMLAIVDSYDFECPLKLAMQRRDVGVMKILLRDTHMRGLSRRMNPRVIDAALVEDNAGFISFMLESDAGIELHLSSGKRAVHVACQHRSLRCLNVLLRAGASLNDLDKSRVSALSYLLWDPPFDKPFLYDLSFSNKFIMPVSAKEREQAVEAVLGFNIMMTDQVDDPKDNRTYGKVICSIACTLLSEPRYFAGFIYCNKDTISRTMPDTMGRSDVMAALEIFANIMTKYNPGPKPRPLLASRLTRQDPD